MVRGLSIPAALGFALAVLVASTPGYARQAARLVYSRDDGASVCLDEAGLRSAVATRLGYNPFDAGAPSTVVASIARRETGFEATVRLHDGGATRGERRLTSTGDDCSEIGEAMALTISILLDSGAMLGEKTDSPPRFAAEPRESPSPLEAPIEPPPPRTGREPLVLRAAVETVASVGAAPAPSVGFVALAGLGKNVYTFDLEARVDLPASLTRSDGTGVRSALLLGSVVPCRHFGVVALCALVSAGVLHGEGLNVGVPDRDTTFYGAVGLRGGVELPVFKHVSVRISATAVLPITRTTLSTMGSAVWTTPFVSGTLALGVLGLF